MIYTLDEKNLESKLAYMLLPFTDYLRSMGAHKKEKVTLFEMFAMAKPPFNPGGKV
jgi:hypothetical protein